SEWRHLIAPADAGPVALAEFGLSSLDPAASLGVLEEHATHVQSSLDLATGLVFKAALFTLPNRGRRLLLVAHHLLVDGVSWRVLLEDLESALDAALRGDKPRLPPKTLSFKSWAEHLLSASHATSLSTEAAFWQQTVEHHVDPLPLDAAVDSNVWGR